MNEKYDHNFTPFVRTLRFTSAEIKRLLYDDAGDALAFARRHQPISEELIMPLLRENSSQAGGFFDYRLGRSKPTMVIGLIARPAEFPFFRR